MPDLTAPFVNFSVHVIGSYGLWAVLLLMLIGSACIPIPSEVVMLYGGFLVSAGQQSFCSGRYRRADRDPDRIAAGVLARRAKGREWLLEIRWLHVTPKRLDAAERWFDRWGAGRCWCAAASR